MLYFQSGRIDTDEALVETVTQLGCRLVMSRLSAVTILSLLLLIGTGCQLVCEGGCSNPSNKLLSREFTGKPQRRIGSYASPTLWTRFMDYEHLGSHGYRFNLSERNGIVYTCRAGHIDTCHVREVADWTGFLAAKAFKHLKKNETKFSFRLKEGARCFVRITYPKDWKYMPKKDQEDIVRDVSIRLGQYCSYTAGTWHEIVTWFGYKSTGIFPEFPSAFSWEDTFSNLLGSHIGSLALRDTERTFSEAVTLLLNRELESLDAQPGDVGKRAANAVKGAWYSGEVPFFVDMRRRNFDIGVDDGFVTPCIISSAWECAGTQAQPYPVPNLDFLLAYGFSMKFQMEPREWEGGKILSIVYPDAKPRKRRLEPNVHFASIIGYIKKEAEEKYGLNVACSSGN